MVKLEQVFLAVFLGVAVIYLVFERVMLHTTKVKKKMFGDFPLLLFLVVAGIAAYLLLNHETFWGIIFGFGALLLLFGKEEQQAFINAPGQYPDWGTTSEILKKGGEKISEGSLSLGLNEFRYWPSYEKEKGGSHYGGRLGRASTSFFDTIKKLFGK